MKVFDLALEYIQKSDDLCEELGLDFGIFINNINRSEVYFDQGLFNDAVVELEKGHAFVVEIDDIKLNKEFYHLYYRVQDALGNVDEANRYYRLYNENKNNYFGDLSKTIIAEWQLQNQKNASIKKQAEYELILERKNRNILVITAILLFLSFITVFIYYINYKRNFKAKKEHELEKQKIAHELEIKSKELMSNALKSISIYSLKESIYKDLKLILSDLPIPQQKKFTKLINKIKHKGDVNVLEEFNVRFKGVYESFYIKLQEIAPELTPSELNICALIRLNLSSKEISTLTNRTVGTVENIRISIRKKLDLPATANLQKELWNIK
jgi:DNA-binding CsgD family transcriptional regulator